MEFKSFVFIEVLKQNIPEIKKRFTRKKFQVNLVIPTEV
jgi:hypothetical protein